MSSPAKTFFAILFVLVFILTCPMICQTASADTWTRPSASGKNFQLAGGTTGVKMIHATWQTRSTTFQAAPDHEWRNTKLGWQQVRVRTTPTIHRLNPPKYRPVFHPFLIAALTLLLALAALSWSSDEWNWDRLVA